MSTSVANRDDWQSPRDLKRGGWLHALELTARIADNPMRILPCVIDDLAERLGEAAALLSDCERFSYAQLTQRSNRYARWALAENLDKGECICLLMPNRPEYLAIWLGLTKVGVVVALLNTSLSGTSLAHSIEIVEPTHIIVAAELLDSFASARPHLSGKAKIWVHGDAAHAFERIDRAIERYSAASLSTGEARPVTIRDRALYIYTSGTTGLPKAAVISHHRVMLWTHWFAGMTDAGPSDRMYACLPMYHSIGGVVAPGSVLVGGGSVLIRERFSARQFWDDVVEHDCTMVQYIGELCRYLLRAPAHPLETSHRLRLCCGNGLRADIWEPFRERFRIPQILEFYAMTEGNISLYNHEQMPGAIGRIPPFLAHRFPIALVKFDFERETPFRNARGCCVACGPDETGEAIGRIAQDRSGLGSRFEGYSSRAESEKKILRDVFEPGDAWFRTGDLMRKDQKGFFYFVDRIGDTFRWKSENVSTFQVAEAIAAFPGIDDANVYGVSIPGTDGRAGMAALVAKPDLDLAALRDHIVRSLPPYARPLFVRIRRTIETTATLKHKKADLVREGYDPSAISDPMYFDDPASKRFVRLDRVLFERIQGGAVRL